MTTTPGPVRNRGRHYCATNDDDDAKDDHDTFTISLEEDCITARRFVSTISSRARARRVGCGCPLRGWIAAGARGCRTTSCELTPGSSSFGEATRSWIPPGTTCTYDLSGYGIATPPGGRSSPLCPVFMVVAVFGLPVLMYVTRAMRNPISRTRAAGWRHVSMDHRTQPERIKGLVDAEPPSTSVPGRPEQNDTRTTQRNGTRTKVVSTTSIVAGRALGQASMWP